MSLEKIIVYLYTYTKPWRGWVKTIYVLNFESRWRRVSSSHSDRFNTLKQISEVLNMLLNRHMSGTDFSANRQIPAPGQDVIPIIQALGSHCIDSSIQ
jgi:hypothetical protein